MGDTINEIPHYFLFLICDLELIMATPLSGMEATLATPEPASANSTESIRCKYKSYSVTTKLDAVKYGLENSKAAAAKKFNVDPKRIREWTDNKRKLEEMLSQSRCTQSKRKRLCGGRIRFVLAPY